jgi:hypothetical protein
MILSIRAARARRNIPNKSRSRQSMFVMSSEFP